MIVMDERIISRATSPIDKAGTHPIWLGSYVQKGFPLLKTVTINYNFFVS